MAIDLATIRDKVSIEEACSAEARWDANSIYELLERTAMRSPKARAVSFQLTSGPEDRVDTLNWSELLTKITQTANAFRGLGLQEGDTIAFLLPNSLETLYTLIAGMTACTVAPINALFEPEKVAEILRATNAKALVTLAPFPKTDMAEKAAEALMHAPDVETLIEIDLNTYLDFPKSWIVPLIRPKVSRAHNAKVLNFHKLIRNEPADALTFELPKVERVSALFHTGGTTGSPKIVQHTTRGALYNAWTGEALLFSADDVVICPLPLFHVFASYGITLPCIKSGAHLVLPTPAGYRGDGVVANFWKLLERYKVTFVITVPTAIAAKLNYEVNADISSLRYAISGSAALPKALFDKFERTTGLKILEGYGMTETTCLISCNPPKGERKLGSVGLPLPYTDVKIMDFSHGEERECATGEGGEICVSNPGVYLGHTYTEPHRNEGLYTAEGFIRTGDLGVKDEDGYVFITGRAKDVIIRGGHNIDPGMIEEAFAKHPQVAFAGAIGQPDAYAGEVPAAYIELAEGADVTAEELKSFARPHILERAAVPVWVEVLDELPKTAVGKVFKPALRNLARQRVYQAALDAVLDGVVVSEVSEDANLGVVVDLSKPDSISDAQIADVLGAFNCHCRNC